MTLKNQNPALTGKLRVIELFADAALKILNRMNIKENIKSFFISSCKSQMRRGSHSLSCYYRSQKLLQNNLRNVIGIPPVRRSIYVPEVSPLALTQEATGGRRNRGGVNPSGIFKKRTARAVLNCSEWEIFVLQWLDGIVIDIIRIRVF